MSPSRSAALLALSVGLASCGVPPALQPPATSPVRPLDRITAAPPEPAPDLEAIARTLPTRRRPHLERLVAAGGNPDLSADVPPLPGPKGQPLSGYQWGLAVGHVPEAWKAGFTGRGTLVAVLDTGADPDNPNLAPNLDWKDARSFVASESDPVDRNGHGSHVAGIIAAAANGTGVVGVAPGATILPIKVLDATGWGADADILKGIDYAIRMGADVINMSLEGLFDKDAAGEKARVAYTTAIRYAESRGALVVVASGNDGQHYPLDTQYEFPAQAGHPLVVGAVGPFMGQHPELAAFYENYGEGFLGLVAPGGGMGFDPADGSPVAFKRDLVLSTWSTHALPHIDQGYPFGPASHMFLGGTSMAAAFVSGVAALAREAHGPQKPWLLKRELLRASGPTDDPEHYGRGLLDAQRAIARS